MIGPHRVMLGSTWVLDRREERAKIVAAAQLKADEVASRLPCAKTLPDRMSKATTEATIFPLSPSQTI
jgi:hypothetical protein